MGSRDQGGAQGAMEVIVVLNSSGPSEFSMKYSNDSDSC